MHYQEIENLFVSLFDTLRGRLSEAHMAQLMLFLDAGEYGIALETLRDILDRHAVEISPSTVCLIDRLKTKMEI